MTENEKKLLAQKLETVEGKHLIEQIKAALDAGNAELDWQSSALDLLEALAAQLIQEQGVTTTPNLDFILSHETIKASDYHFDEIGPGPDESLDDYLLRHGVDLSGDLMTQFFDPYEVNQLASICDEVNQKFSKKTSIINKTDLAFLAIATALQTVKALLFPIVAEKFGYGESFDPEKRFKHNDPKIKNDEKAGKDRFKGKHKGQSTTRDGERRNWLNILSQSPVAYDVTKGSKELGLDIGGKYHRLYSLGHDPVLGWIFGTMNILTDTITFNTMESHRIERIKDPIRITKISDESVLFGSIISETYELTIEDNLNLAASIFMQGLHLKSDEFTKLGLPVPVISTFDPELAGKLYKENYDSLCFARDSKIIGTSAIISAIINMIISLVHGLFYNPNEGISRDLYEVRTRKILLISNVIASTSSVISTVITRNPKNLDIGGLLITITRLFSDIRFMTKIKKEFIESETSTLLEEKLTALGY